MVQRTAKVDLSTHATSDEGALDEVGSEHCTMHAVRVSSCIFGPWVLANHRSWRIST